MSENSHDNCTHCGSRELLEVAATPSQHSHIVVMVRDGGPVMRAVRISRYVCTDCGRIEQWINNTDDLNQLKATLLSGDDETAGDATAVKLN